MQKVLFRLRIFPTMQLKLDWICFGYGSYPQSRLDRFDLRLNEYRPCRQLKGTSNQFHAEYPALTWEVLYASQAP